MLNRLSYRFASQVARPVESLRDKLRSGAGLLALVVLVVACPGSGDGPRGIDVAQRQSGAAGAAIAALQAGRFAEAEQSARRVLSADNKNPQARLVSAISTYILTGDRLFQDVFTLSEGIGRGAVNYAALHSALEQIEKSLERVESDLAVASRSPDVALELCPAGWQVDWNHNGSADDRDQRLFEIELDADGNELPPGDPRRRPTFRFDLGDVYWARAMIAFQQAAVQLLLGYQLSDLGGDLESTVRKTLRDQGQLTIHLADGRRVTRARELILAGIAHAERSQKEYLAETDDDREWVPNPRQRNHPLPLPVDDALYETWSSLLSDAKKLVSGEEGLSAREAIEVIGVRVLLRPSGFLNLRTLLFEPKDIVISTPDLKDALLRPDNALRSLFGAAYVESLPPSRLLSRLMRMREEVRNGSETFARKLRYVFWLN